MKNFEHINARTAAGAVKLLNADPRSCPIAGGTDLLTQMKSGISAPDRLVNLKTIPGLSDIEYNAEDGLELGPLATLDSIMINDTVRKHYPALRQAISLAASPQLRNFGTIGGNLVQASRCWYYRGPFNCWLKGGETCYARNGENSHHAILGAGACNSVQPSDPAIALVALAADVTIAGPQSKQMMPLERFFQVPSLQSRQLTVLKPGEIVLKITVPATESHSRGIYLKAMDRKIWAFALASVAAQFTFEAEIVKDVHLVLGGVAAMPWRVPDAESFLIGKVLDDKNIGRAAELAVTGAKPLAQNGYKIALVKGIVTEALHTIEKESLDLADD